MKKISKLISLSVIMCLLISSLCVMNVSAATGDLLFDMDLSGFEKGEQGTDWGITNNGSSTTATIKLNDGETEGGTSTGNITLESFTNVKGEDVPYLNYNQIHKAGTYNGPNANNRIWIEDEAWADQMLTAEVWLKAEPTSATRDELLRLYGEDDDDRSSLDRVINLDLSTEGSWMIDSTTSTDVAAGVSATNASNGEWVHVAITRGLSNTNTGGSTNIYLYVNGTRINQTGRGLKAVTEKVAGLLLGTYRVSSTDYAPHNFGVASVKIYEGKLSTDTIKAHYNAECADYTLAPETLEVKSYSPAPATTLISHKAGSFTATFNNCINEETIDSGIGLFDKNDEEVLTYKTLSADMKTVTLTPAGYLAEGDYNIKVNSELTSLNDKSATAAESSAYTIDLFEYNAAEDFAAIEAIEGGCTVSDISSTCQSGYISGWQGTGGSANYQVNNGILTMQDTNKSASTFFKVSLPVGDAFSTGNVEFSFSVMGGNETYNLLQITSSLKDVLYYKPDTGISRSLSKESVAFENKEGDIKNGEWYDVTVAFSRNDTSENWQYTVYMKDGSGKETATTSYDTGIDDNLSAFYLYNSKGTGADSYQPMQLKNISLKHVISHGGYLSGRVISGGDIVYYSYDKDALLGGVDDNAIIIVAAYKGDEMLAVDDVVTKEEAYSTGSLTFDKSIDGAITLKLIKLDNLDNLYPLSPAVVATADLYPAGE